MIDAWLIPNFAQGAVTAQSVPLRRAFSIRHEFANAWYQLLDRQVGELPIGDRFPFLFRARPKTIARVSVQAKPLEGMSLSGVEVTLMRVQASSRRRRITLNPPNGNRGDAWEGEDSIPNHSFVDSDDWGIEVTADGMRKLKDLVLEFEYRVDETL